MARCIITVFLVTVLIVLITGPQETTAKRGCAAFGHSCYGGHGKRTDNGLRVIDIEQPSPDFVSGPGEDEEFIGNDRLGGNDFSQYQFSPLLRRWLQMLHQSGQLMDRKK